MYLCFQQNKNFIESTEYLMSLTKKEREILAAIVNYAYLILVCFEIT